jgi:hypothetical protein
LRNFWTTAGVFSARSLRNSARVKSKSDESQKFNIQVPRNRQKLSTKCAVTLVILSAAKNLRSITSIRLFNKPEMFRCAQHDRVRDGAAQFGDWSFFGIWKLGFGASGSQPHRVPGIKTVWRPVNSLPARRPFAAITVVRRSVESQPGNHCERVTLARVDRDPFAHARFAIAAKLR